MLLFVYIGVDVLFALHLFIRRFRRRVQKKTKKYEKMKNKKNNRRRFENLRRTKASATQCSTGALLRMLRHGVLQTCAVEGTYEPLDISPEFGAGTTKYSLQQRTPSLIPSFIVSSETSLRQHMRVPSSPSYCLS